MQEEFVRLIHEHQRIVHKICLLYRNTKEDQEDLYQEIVFQLWKSYPSFQKKSKFSSWMYRIALNTALATFRKKKAQVIFTDAIPEMSNQCYPTTSNQEALLFWAIKKLKDTEKALVSLYLEDFSYQEMAEITGLSESNIGVKLNRIKKKLKKLLNQ
ncbi:MAG: RNA polymerase sigma factor [Flammeovirgaceae bacterium]